MVGELRFALRLSRVQGERERLGFPIPRYFMILPNNLHAVKQFFVVLRQPRLPLMRRLIVRAISADGTLGTWTLIPSTVNREGLGLVLVRPNMKAC